MPSRDLISLFVAPLNRLGVTYMVTGAVAAIVYGEPRLTNDIDVVVVLSGADLPRLREAFPSHDFYVPPIELMEAAIRQAADGHFNLIHNDTALKAAVYPAGQDPLHRWAMARRRRITIQGETVWLAPPEYVIIRKLQYFRSGGSDKHRSDIQAMLRVLGDDVDRAALLVEVRGLGLEADWQSLAGQR